MKKILKIKPFLRWAGGKSWLIKHLEYLIGDLKYNNYHEPFLGGGSVFLAINPKKKSYLSDLNADLIKTYQELRRRPLLVINELKQYKNTEEFYYHLRESYYDDPIKIAARFIYLNQTSFNGIYRVNLKGKYNVPYGFRKKNFLEAEKLLSVSERLQSTYLMDGDFGNVKNNLSEKDLVFLDPPYTVSHNNNGFIKYNQKLFSIEDQYRLSELIDFIKSKNAYYILTNAAHFKVKEIFDKGDTILEKQRANLIGGLNAERGQTTELIFTNTL